MRYTRQHILRGAFTWIPIVRVSQLYFDFVNLLSIFVIEYGTSPRGLTAIWSLSTEVSVEMSVIVLYFVLDHSFD